MAFRIAMDGSKQGERVFLQTDEQNGKPVFLFVRQVPKDMVRELRKDYARGIRTDKMAKRPAADTLERIDELNIRRAAYALTGSENFSLEMAEPKAAAAFSEALGRPVAVGESVVLDGQWTEAVRVLVCGNLPGFADRVVEIEKGLTRLKEADEEEQAATFRGGVEVPAGVREGADGSAR